MSAGFPKRSTHTRAAFTSSRRLARRGRTISLRVVCGYCRTTTVEVGWGTSTSLHHPPPTSPTCRCLVPEHLRESDDPSGDADDDPEKAQVVAHAGAFLRDHQLIAVLHVQIVEGAPLRDGLGELLALEEAFATPFQ